MVSRELIVVSRKSNLCRDKSTVLSRELANSRKQPFLLSFQLEVKASPSLELDFLTVSGELSMLWLCPSLGILLAK